MAIVSYTQEELDQIKRERAAEFAAESKALEEMPDDEIDCSEIPEITNLDGWMTVPELEAYLAAKRKQAVKI